ncbi:MAG: RNA methyltransferase [Bacteroidales bacterium]|nr:RNA methyltransferase [Bacteroidales bacterium]MCF8389243.1 RNA methyltransferase [Bacteroidales bacterium]
MRKLKLEELNRLSTEEFKKASRHSVSVVLDNIRSMNNTGSAFRTCDAFRVEKLYLCGITAQPPNKEIHKTALGATESVDWEYAEDTLSLIRELKTAGYTICSVEQAEGSSILGEFDFDSSMKLALIFGNEVNGVQQEVINESDFCIEIPQHGTKHSFNISVSIGIVLWELLKNRSL